jgi:hypothetical protein
MYTGIGYEICYREVLYLLKSARARTLSKDDALALFTQRCDDLLSVSSTDNTIR